MNIIEGKNGQLSFLEDVNIEEIEPKEPYIVEFIKSRIKVLQAKLSLLSKFNNECDNGVVAFLDKELEKEYSEFIYSFIKMYETLSMEELSFIQENFSSEYHKLCKLLLEYLKRYVYDSGIATRLDDPVIIQIENLILMDQISFRDSHFKEIKNTIKNRGKLRVNNYLIFNGAALINKFNLCLPQEERDAATEALNNDITALVTNTYTKDIFLKMDEDFVAKEQKGTLSMLLLYYLDACVYSEGADTRIPSSVIEKLELFVIYHFSNGFALNATQKKIYEKVKLSVGTKLASFIRIEAAKIEDHLRDFDELESFKASNQYKLIEETEDVESLPMVISEQELKLELESFLDIVFMLHSNFKKENLPIFSKGLEDARYKAMEIGLSYLERFVYRNSNTGNKITEQLEDYIYTENGFTVTNPTLCLAKSTLYRKTGTRYVKRSIDKQRNLPQV